MHWLDYLTVIGYLVFTIGLGIYFGRHQSRVEFFRASGNMGWLTVGLSVMATLFSSNSFVFYPSAAFDGTLLIGLSLISFTFMTPVIVYFFIPVFTRLNCQTAYDYLERRYHVSVRCLASGLFVLLRIAWMASATYAASLVVATVAGVNQTSVILTLGIVAIVYTMMGGLRAVMWTDVIQFAIFALTIFIALCLIISMEGTSVSGIASSYFGERDGIFYNFEPSMTLQYGSWAILFGVFLEAVSAFGADQVAVQRYLAASSEQTAKMGSWINLAGMWLVIPGLLAIGVGLYAYYPQHPEELIPVLRQEQISHPDNRVLADYLTTLDAVQADRNSTEYQTVLKQADKVIRETGLEDKVMPQFVRDHFIPGMTGLFLAALMAAIMSSIDSGIHSVTTAIIVDFRDRLKPEWTPANDEQDVRTIRFLVVLIGLIAVTLACFVGPLGNVFDIGKKMTSAFGGPLLGVFVLAMFFKRTNTLGVFVGVLCSAAITLYLIYERAEWFSVWFWPIGFGLSIVLSLIVSLFGTCQASDYTYYKIVHPKPNKK